MSARRAALDFQWRRFKGFLKQFGKSKRAIIGIVVLVFYVGFALVAPFVTPYDPLYSNFLAGEFAKPTWLSGLPGGSSLSQNMQLFSTPGFSSPSSLQDQGWNVTQSPAGAFVVHYNKTQSAALPNSTLANTGSEEIDYSRTAGSPAPGVAIITISKSFVWPYSGSPWRFAGSLELLMSELQGVNAVKGDVFISSLGLPLPIYNVTLDRSLFGEAISPGFSLDSHSSNVKQLYTPSDPAQYIFLGKGAYAYGVQFTVPDDNQAVSVGVKLFLTDLNLRLYGTSFGLLGTDQYGRDIFSQLAWGTRVSLLVGLVASVVAVAIGLAVGLVAGYLGRVVDEVLMRSTDLLLVLPGLPLLIILAALLGPSIWNVIAILALLGWPGFARIIRAQVLSIKERSFIEASKAAGSGVSHVITKHVLPNVMGLTYVNLALSVPTAIVTEASLAFLGLRDPNVISWGGMLNDVQGTGNVASWWWVLPPGLSIALLSLSFILLGYALDEILNPRLRMRR
ncbi:ABC transporter permease [Candidatus Bathyarchaeota archaeon]|nr:MAG: ABC transporter permease [Candidatus Bathyarchaeota archaeon]